MMYLYKKLPDETEVVHSQIITDGMPKVIVNFERPTEDGFDSARCEVPGIIWTSIEGYSSEEIYGFEDFLQINLQDIIERAKSKSMTGSNIKEEKINGTIYTQPKAEAYQYGIVSGNISTAIYEDLYSNVSLVFTGNLDLKYHPDLNDDYVTPDIMVVTDRTKLKDGSYYGVPPFVVEIISPTTVLRDRKDKLHIYQETGISEYWIVSSMERAVEIYYLVAGQYELKACYILQDDPEEENYNADQIIVLREFPGIGLTLARIFENRD